MKKEHSIDVTISALYTIHFDVVKLLLKLYQVLLKKFELPGCRWNPLYDEGGKRFLQYLCPFNLLYLCSV